MRTALACFLASFLCALPSARAQQAAAQPFTQADLERLVAEVASVAPQNPNYGYPVVAHLVEKDEVNAGSYCLLVGDKLVAQLDMMTGLVRCAHGDQRLLRAVVAHEIGHLALGHLLESTQFKDMSVVHTRQQEFEADSAGVAYLAALGHPRKDMIDVLLLLDLDSKMRSDPWLATVVSDHASPITRASRIAPDDALFAAVNLFEIGLAYMECRRFEHALSWFDEARARAKPWNLPEADLDAASAALQNYYDLLPAGVQEQWLRPEFGPHLTDVPVLRGRGGLQISEKDLTRYADALRRIEAAATEFTAPMKSFLLGTAHVLDPRGDEQTLRRGVAELQAVLDGKPLTGWGPQALRLGVANNLALGLQRLGDEKRAARLLIAEQVRDPRFVPSVAENLARLPLDELSPDEAKVAVGVLFSFLSWTPVDAPGSRTAERVYEQLKKKHQLEVKAELVRAPIALCGVATMTIDGHEVGLFDSFAKVSETLGSIPMAGYPNPRLPDLRYLYWGDAEVIALVEGDQLVKLTSYRPDTSIELRPIHDSGLRTTYRLKVGMTQAELEAILRPAGGAAALQPQPVRLLDRRTFAAGPSAPAADPAKPQAPPEASPEEIWLYYPSLDFGVLILDGRVAGLTVTPVAQQ